jgi:putative ABC transport system permease protein
MRLIHHGLTELRAHPWRAALSGISLCIGVLAVVGISTVGTITREVFIAVEEQHNGRLITTRAEANLPAPTPETIRDALRAAAPLEATGGAAALIAHPRVVGIGRPDEVKAGGPTRAVQEITMVAGDIERVRRLPMLDGRWFDGRSTYPVELVLDQPAAARWGGPGTRLMIQVTDSQPPVSAMVVGVTADGTGDPDVFAPLPALLHVRPTVLDGVPVDILLHHPTASIATLTDLTNKVVRAAHGKLGDGGVVRVDSVDELINQLDAQQRAFALVAIVALAIAAIGILNIGLASIAERARELVIRRAVGATRSAILGQILFAALVVGFVAAGAATLLAVVGVEWWVPQRISPATAIDPPGLPWPAMVLGVAAASLTTLLGSALPAVVAARLDVATALRD